MKTQSFYTGTTLTEFPSDNEFYDVVEELLLSYGIIGEIVIDAVKNTLFINSSCDITMETLDAQIKVGLDISYDINCETCDTECSGFTLTANVCRVCTNPTFVWTNCDTGLVETYTIIEGEIVRICSTKVPVVLSGDGDVLGTGSCTL